MNPFPAVCLFIMSSVNMIWRANGNLAIYARSIGPRHAHDWDTCREVQQPLPQQIEQSSLGSLFILSSLFFQLQR